ncbi:uncharacterized protein KQ657_003988 [Scheffersomyces spartinae]|uniref:non-specific serine/threonine protein kinase n=1 Tax=Scheffersomyces spartinae TaxID=45513 RepID=A0A9P8AJK0_9ASCO|nr:uncharacterized protein KQ657_003988 [Scheffersomyces spartinae]KAG7194880.1 hypothetical protein KQ657_003988 [Scheffersomyces spartinae]
MTIMETQCEKVSSSFFPDDPRLNKFRETSEQNVYTGDFQLDDSAEGVPLGKLSAFAPGSVVVQKGRMKQSHDGSKSPFLRRIENQIQGASYSCEPSTVINTTTLADRMSPIEEVSGDDDRMVNPFVSSSNNNNKGIAYAKIRPEKRSKNTAAAVTTATGTVQMQLQASSLTNQITSTPSNPRRKQRDPSVKISLTPAQRFQKQPGTRLNNALENFRFCEMVGRGAYAQVYKGINLKTNQVVAIKQIWLQRDQNVAALMGEIDLLKVLRHPNIVKYHGFVKTSTSLNILLEFCGGGSLRQLYLSLGHGLLEFDIIGYIGPVLEGLSYLHEQGVVHRDVKAANVLLTEDGEVKLADFGVAAKITNQHATVIGTPNWMAPETVLGGEGLCTASDIWSLGATIIELFTTHPPYHELNQMAVLHAIGVDERPPLPKNISTILKDFLLECFQKQASLRISAKLLLKHKWLTSANKEASKGNSMKQQQEPFLNVEENDANWLINSVREEEEKQQQQHLPLPKALPQREIELTISQEVSKSAAAYTALNKRDLLHKFAEDEDEIKGFEADFIGDEVNPLSKSSNSNKEILSNMLPEQDPFLEVDIENFDTNEIEIQSKMEYLIGKLAQKVDQCHSGSENLMLSLVKITGRILHIAKKYPILHEVFIRDHGVLTILELLDFASEYPKQNRLWYQTLAILNKVFERNVIQFENFCLLGGIPAVTYFRKSTFEFPVRLQVIKFITYFHNSTKALSMFVSSGGLKVLSVLVEEDFDSAPEFPITSIECIHRVLSDDFSRSKSDMCRMLSKFGVIFWFVVLLNRLSKIRPTDHYKSISADRIQCCIDSIMTIIKYFSDSEARVRSNIASVDLFKLLIKVYPSLILKHQLVILKFFKSMAEVSNVLQSLYSADILEFLLGIIKEYDPPTKQNYKAVFNIVSPLLYSCCNLNQSREKDIVKLGLVPYLRKLSKINLPFRQFILPIICELAYIEDTQVQIILERNDIITVYFNLLLDPFWQSTALDSIIVYYQRNSAEIQSSKAIDCLASGFMLPKVSNLESALDSYLYLVSDNQILRTALFKDTVIQNIFFRLKINANNPVIQLNLLKILRELVLHAEQTSESLSLSVAHVSSLKGLQNSNASVLVEGLAHEILQLMDQ